MSTDVERRDFIRQAVVGAVSLSGLSCASASAPRSLVDGAARAAVPPIAGPWYFSWVDRIRAPHRAVFESSQIMNGEALLHAWLFMDGYREAHGLADSDVQAVIVMRHGSLPMGLGDYLWQKYAIGEKLKINDSATKQPATRNPYLASSRGGVNGAGTIEGLRARGAIFLACNMAAMGFAQQIAQETGLAKEAARAEIRQNLAPGVILMPSGIFAVLRAQDAGCKYYKSS
jgi:hypothetical protein